MKKLLLFLGMIVAVFATTNVTVVTPAHAQIECNGAYQVIRGHGELSTPYCEIKYLAQVAHSYGYKESFQDIRKSFFLKQRICDHIGEDIRVNGICASFRSDQGSDDIR